MIIITNSKLIYYKLYMFSPVIIMNHITASNTSDAAIILAHNGICFLDRPSSNLSTCLHPYDLAVLHDATYQVFIENLTLSLLSVTQINYRGTAIMILLNSCYELSIDHIIQKFQATKQVVFLCTMYQFYSCMNLLFYVSKFKIIFLIIRISSG